LRIILRYFRNDFAALAHKSDKLKESQGSAAPKEFVIYRLPMVIGNLAAASLLSVLSVLRHLRMHAANIPPTFLKSSNHN
jgi:hypothetical protein